VYDKYNNDQKTNGDENSYTCQGRIQDLDLGTSGGAAGAENIGDSLRGGSNVPSPSVMGLGRAIPFQIFFLFLGRKMGISVHIRALLSAKLFLAV